jgi:hypothetical protein
MDEVKELNEVVQSCMDLVELNKDLGVIMSVEHMTDVQALGFMKAYKNEYGNSIKDISLLAKMLPENIMQNKQLMTFLLDGVNVEFKSVDSRLANVPFVANSGSVNFIKDIPEVK